jgi:hypothetical protein
MEKLKQKITGFFSHKRMKSFYWRAADFMAVEGGAALLETLTELEVPQIVVAGLGLALGEITKHLNRKNK